MNKLKKLINFLNRLGGIHGEEFAIDEVDKHIERFGFDEPSLNTHYNEK